MKKIRNLLVLALVTITIVFIIKVQSANNNRPLAGDFPRGALVFAQVNNLPEMLESWNQSELKERYLSSNNYEQFVGRHLATKISERLYEFSFALGFDFNEEFFKELSSKEAAIALYDIGRIEFVFIAPLDEEKYLLSKLVENQAGFEEIKLKSGLSYFVMPIEVDRGRQNQNFTFALQNGRIILTNSEQLMVRTLTNINSKFSSQTVDRLTSDPTYQALTKKITPHYATIWVAQEKLNQDWYFRNYWIMNNITDLKNIRAAIFDIDLQEKEWREERYFLTNSVLPSTKLSSLDTRYLYNQIPSSLPYFKIESASNSKELSKTIHAYLFDNDTEPIKTQKSKSKYANYVQTEVDEYYNDYYSYDNYATEINDPLDAEDLETTPEQSFYNRKTAMENLKQVFDLAQARTVVKMQKPQAIEGALFAEFHKAFIISFENPSQFNKTAFENAIARLAADSTMIAGNSASISWQPAKNKEARMLVMPMLGWQIAYTLKDNCLILSNSTELLKEILANPSKSVNKNPFKVDIANSNNFNNLNDLVVINFSNREEAFDNIFNKIQSDSIDNFRQTHVNQGDQDFFVNNIASLLDAISDVEKIIITRDSQSNYLHEVIAIKIKQKE